MSRWITGEDLWNYIRDFIDDRYPGSDFRQGEDRELVFQVTLSEKARADLTTFLKAKKLLGTTQLVSNSPKPTTVHFSSKAHTTRRGREEWITQFHPLVRFASHAIGAEVNPFYPAVLVDVRTSSITRMQAGLYPFYVGRWSFTGLRVIEKLVFQAAAIDSDGGLTPLDADNAEWLVTRAAMHGTDGIDAGAGIEYDTVAWAVEQLMLRSFEEYDSFAGRIAAENSDRVRLQKAAVRKHLQRQMESLQRVRASLEEKGRTRLIPATEGRMNRLSARMAQRLAELESAGDTRHERSDVCLGLINVR